MRGELRSDWEVKPGLTSLDGRRLSGLRLSPQDRGEFRLEFGKWRDGSSPPQVIHSFVSTGRAFRLKRFLVFSRAIVRSSSASFKAALASSRSIRSKEAEIINWNDSGQILPTAGDNGPLLPIGGTVYDFGKFVPRFRDIEACHGVVPLVRFVRVYNQVFRA